MMISDTEEPSRAVGARRILARIRSSINANCHRGTSPGALASSRSVRRRGSHARRNVNPGKEVSDRPLSPSGTAK